MAKVKHLGPGDVVSIDGIDIAKGAELELDEDQIRRLQASGADLEVDRTVPMTQAPTTTWTPDDERPAQPKKNAAGTTGTKED